MKNKLLWGVLVAMMAGVAGIALLNRPTASPPADNPASPQPAQFGAAPEFTLTDQAGRPFDSRALRGQVWITDFIFTSCAGACPEMSRQMALLQKRLPAEVQLVSVSVDPARDSPPVLAEYAARFGAEAGRWHFLTGEPAAVTRLVQQGFRLSIAEGTSPQEPITHSQRFVLVNRQGMIRGYYDSTDPQKLDQLVRDAQSVISSREAE